MYLFFIFKYLDEDECNGTNSCDITNGGCTNTVGSYNCTCDSGYMLNVDGSTCDGTLTFKLFIQYELQEEYNILQLIPEPLTIPIHSYNSL